MLLTTVLLDLDGVVRHFDPGHVAAIERKHGMELGTLRTAAFEAELIDRVVTGRMRRSEWVQEVGARVGNPAAAIEWMSHRGRLDSAMIDEVAALRSRGIVVAILTNGTDTIAAEAVELGLVDKFDGIYNSAEIGFAKPDRRVFEHVCAALQVDPTTVFFTDDSQSKLAGAIEIGMTARRFVGVEAFRRQLIDLGLTKD